MRFQKFERLLFFFVFFALLFFCIYNSLGLEFDCLYPKNSICQHVCQVFLSKKIKFVKNSFSVLAT